MTCRVLGVQLLIYPELDSTNNQAIRLGQDLADRFVLVAHRQTQGRGKGARKWVSDSEAGLYVSFGLRVSGDVVQEDPTEMVMGIARDIAALLSDVSGASVEVEWPNDLIADGKKIGGILLESVVLDAEDGRRLLVIGIGLNINQLRFEGMIEHVATSLQLVTGKRYDMGMILNRLMGWFRQWR